jgi:hypothetical protein
MMLFPYLHQQLSSVIYVKLTLNSVSGSGRVEDSYHELPAVLIGLISHYLSLFFLVLNFFGRSITAQVKNL